MARVRDPDDGGNEQSPLLKSVEQAPTYSSSSHVWILLLVVALVISIDVPITLASAPQTRLFEAIYCAKWFKTHDLKLIGESGWVDEQYCKIDAVQSQVASLKGWLAMFDQLPGFTPLSIITCAFCRYFS